VTAGQVPAPELLSLAQQFADEVTDRMGRIVPLGDRFSALTAGDNQSGRVTVMVLDPEDNLKARLIPLTINGKSWLRLLVKFNCCWDRGKDFLAVDASLFHILIGEKERDEPLFRYEYLRQPRGLVPASHLQIHAHRDEFLHMLMVGDEGRPKVRQRQGKVTRMSVFHFPLGGHRFRPCLEDVLEALILEFGVDRQGGWKAAVDEGREAWRRTQLKAAIRDAPSDAAEVLEMLGWKLTPPEIVPADVVDRLRAF
jgi:hypothetical protein